ncbi:MAG TPA: Wzz/FepE/Etk N-terminal domain-containing protein, partial [Gemmatimonadaceae bacterium]|nr:Wzz/FepE/Etk N-terminal domain-containing protein [Gemmatimonadaceae bacterium]
MTAPGTINSAPLRLADVIVELRARWLTIALCTLVGMLLGLGWWALTPRTWTANSRFVPQVRRNSQSQPL